MIPFLTIFFIAFIAILTYQFKKTTQEQKEVDERFWQREQEANSTPRKDISNLDYITIPEDLFPLNLGTTAENQIALLVDQKMLNLTGKTNTDLKLDYGVSNLEFLTQCDDNFTTLVRYIPDYAGELVAADQADAARNILEFAVENLADSKSIFSSLANMYVNSGEADKIPSLIEKAEHINSLSKNAIISELYDIIESVNNTAAMEQAAETAANSYKYADEDDDDFYSFLKD